MADLPGHSKSLAETGAQTPVAANFDSPGTRAITQLRRLPTVGVFLLDHSSHSFAPKNEQYSGIPHNPVVTDGIQRKYRHMPEISRFFGIVVTMFYHDHLPAHFHVRYEGRRAIIDIDSLEVLAGTLSPKALRLVREWATLHGEELLTNWQRARAQHPLCTIAPLE